jgi:cell division protein FtsL
MRIAATGAAVALTLISAWALYTESANTRQIEQQLMSSERLRERIENDIAVLKAERAYLAQPARIEQAARGIGMRPALERQYVQIESLIETATDGAELGEASAPAAIPLPAR